jgi:hypothetical protein
MWQVPPPLMFQAKLAVPVAPVVSLTVTVMVTVLLPEAVGVPEIRPVEVQLPLDVTRQTKNLGLRLS